MDNAQEALLQLLHETFKELVKRIDEIPRSGTSDILTREELCERLKISDNHIQTLEKQGVIPCYKLGKVVRYDWKKVQAALDAEAQEKQNKNKTVLQLGKQRTRTRHEV